MLARADVDDDKTVSMGAPPVDSCVFVRMDLRLSWLLMAVSEASGDKCSFEDLLRLPSRFKVENNEN